MDYVYGSGLDTTISLLTSLSSNSTTLESLTYLGLGTLVKRAHPEPGVDLTYIKQSGEGNGDAGDQYTGLDRFGRVVDQRWIKTSDGSHTDRFKYGYDRDSNRLYRENVVNAAFSELYHADGGSAGYDNLNQLVEFQRGTLSDTNSDNVPDTVASSSRSQSWTMDGQGNWSSLNTDGSSVSRTHNKQNQVTVVGSANLSFDSNGNLTTDQNGQQYVYDAWNRLVTVKDSGSTTIASYEYDTLGRRIQQTENSTTTDFYFSAGWQVLEEQVSGTAKMQYVWSPVYIDAMIERDRDADGNAGNGLEERLYVQQDANFNVTAIISTSGTVVERYIYDPYGSISFLSSGWTGPADGYAWRYLHQGGKFESATGLYNFRNRDLHPTLGRWIQVDPLGFGAGDADLYRYESNGSPGLMDAYGLQHRHPQNSFGNGEYGSAGGNGGSGGLGGGLLTHGPVLIHQITNVTPGHQVQQGPPPALPRLEALEALDGLAQMANLFGAIIASAFNNFIARPLEILAARPVPRGALILDNGDVHVNGQHVGVLVTTADQANVAAVLGAANPGFRPSLGIGPGAATAGAPVSRTAVEGLANSYRGLPAAQRPATVARLETRTGSFGGRSSYAGEAHPVVRQLADANPGRFNGACAECDAISQAIRAHEAATGQAITTVQQARQALTGSCIQTARVRGPNSTAHGTPLPPCETCQPLLDALNVRYR